jgi:hypothetical protein
LKSRFDFGYQQEFKGRLNFNPIEGFEIGWELDQAPMDQAPMCLVQALGIINLNPKPTSYPKLNFIIP